MREGVTYKNFEDCLEKVKYPRKILSKDYLREGLFPIVSQEDELISGYWDNEADLYKVEKPIVIFGDHTRVLKYIDFSFVMGADGVKLLVPKENLDAKYLYYFLKWYKIPSLGYSRHYKLLKEISLPVPSLGEQQRIVSELDRLASIISDKQQQLRELDNLAQTIFYSMFGDPVNNERKWETRKIGQFAELIAGATPSTAVKEYWENGTISWLSSGEVNKGRIYDTDSKITQLGYDNCSTRLVPAHTLLIALAGQGKTRGTVGVAEIPLCTNQSICSFLLDKTFNVDFLYYLLKYEYNELRSISNSAGGRGGLNLGLLRAYSVISPELTLQQQFAEKVNAIEEQNDVLKQSIAEFENLLAQRMEYHFA